jgi:hypothetical protein
MYLLTSHFNSDHGHILKTLSGAHLYYNFLLINKNIELWKH